MVHNVRIIVVTFYLRQLRFQFLEKARSHEHFSVVRLPEQMNRRVQSSKTCMSCRKNLIMFAERDRWAKEGRKPIGDGRLDEPTTSAC